MVGTESGPTGVESVPLRSRALVIWKDVLVEREYAHRLQSSTDAASVESSARRPPRQTIQSWVAVPDRGST